MQCGRARHRKRKKARRGQAREDPAVVPEVFVVRIGEEARLRRAIDLHHSLRLWHVERPQRNCIERRENRSVLPEWELTEDVKFNF